MRSMSPKNACRISAGCLTALVLIAGLPVREGQATDTFATYRSHQSPLPVSFEYPAGWEVEPSEGKTEAYAQVQVYAPAAFEPRLRVYLVVRVMPTAASGGRYASVDEAAAAYRETLLPTLRIDEAQETTALGVTARQVVVSGTLRLPWMSAAAHPVPVTGRRLFFEKGGRLYECAWLSTPDTAARVQAFFEHVLQTLTVTVAP